MTTRTDNTAPEHRWPAATGKFNITQAEARQKTQRAAKKASAAAKYRIGEDHVGFAEMAARLRVSERTVRDRYNRAKALPGPITWERLA